MDKRYVNINEQKYNVEYIEKLSAKLTELYESRQIMNVNDLAKCLNVARTTVYKYLGAVHKCGNVTPGVKRYIKKYYRTKYLQ